MPAPLRPLSGRRRFTLLAVAALIVVGGALAAGSGFLLVTPVVTPAPSPAADRTGLAVAGGDQARDAGTDREPARRDRDRLHPQRRTRPAIVVPEAQLPDAAAVDRRHRRACPSRAAGRRRGQPDPPRLVARWDSPAVLGRDQAVPDRPGRWPATAGRHRLRAAVTDDAALLPIRCRGRVLERRPQHRLRPVLHRCGRVDRCGGASRRWISRAVGCPS